MKIISVSRVQANENPQVLTLTMDVEQSDGSFDHGVIYTYSPAGLYGGELQSLVAQWLVDHQGEFTVEAYSPAPPIPAVYQIAKTTPWLRMTDAEGDLVYAAMSETSSRLRAIYDAATFLSSGDPLWSTMHDILAATLSPTRADELLAPET